MEVDVIFKVRGSKTIYSFMVIASTEKSVKEVTKTILKIRNRKFKYQHSILN